MQQGGGREGRREGVRPGMGVGPPVHVAAGLRRATASGTAPGRGALGCWCPAQGYAGVGGLRKNWGGEGRGEGQGGSRVM